MCRKELPEQAGERTGSVFTLPAVPNCYGRMLGCVHCESICHHGQGCAEVRLRLCWVWGLPSLFPRAERSQVVALLLALPRELLPEISALRDAPLRARCCLGASLGPEELGCSAAAPGAVNAQLLPTAGR